MIIQYRNTLTLRWFVVMWNEHDSYGTRRIIARFSTQAEALRFIAGQ